MIWPSQLSDASRTGFELAQDLGFTSFKCGGAVAATANFVIVKKKQSKHETRLKMDTFHCVKKSPPLVNEIEKVQKKKWYNTST